MKIQEIWAKSIITKSNLPDTDYVINPYVGCSHGCIYCYARFMKRFSDHEQDGWGEFVDVKINASQLVDKFKPDKLSGKSVFISSVTDPYHTVEKKYEVTRKILERLIYHGKNSMTGCVYMLGIQTKSSLILRDLDLLKTIKEQGVDLEVGFTITTLDDKIRKEVEPRCSTVEARTMALKDLNQAGIRTYVFVGPILPQVTDWREIVNQTKTRVSFYYFENLTVRGGIWPDVKRWLISKHPGWLPVYERIYFSQNEYWGQVEREIYKFGQENDLEFKIYFHH